MKVGVTHHGFLLQTILYTGVTVCLTRPSNSV